MQWPRARLRAVRPTMERYVKAETDAAMGEGFG